MNKPHSDPGEEIGRGCDPLFAKGCVRPELEMGMLLPCDARSAVPMRHVLQPGMKRPGSCNA
jgi:hypothetical protein